MMQKIAILGSTGSIGTNALDVVSRLKGMFEVVGLAVDSNVKLLAKQARIFRPKIISVGNKEAARKAKRAMPAGTKVVFGLDGLREIVTRPDIDQVVFAIAGSFCLLPLIDAIKTKKRIALANKESLVSAGHLITDLAKSNNVYIIPIDSEHSAIFQCLNGRKDSVSRIYLTGSGGPLLDVPKARFDKLTRRAVLSHPKWKMGEKISVDSATMMNKGLEIIEAKHLFGIREDYIDVLVHPEAVVHSMVEFIDGSVMAQLANPDMRLPIQYALTYPLRYEAPVRRIDFAKSSGLTFRRPDSDKFPCLELARGVARSEGTAPAVLCASDEEAVEAYLKGRIKFTDIHKIIGKVLSRHKNAVGKAFTVGDVMTADGWAREEARRLCCR